MQDRVAIIAHFISCVLFAVGVLFLPIFFGAVLEHVCPNPITCPASDRRPYEVGLAIASALATIGLIGGGFTSLPARRAMRG